MQGGGGYGKQRRKGDEKVWGKWVSAGSGGREWKAGECWVKYLCRGIMCKYLYSTYIAFPGNKGEDLATQSLISPIVRTSRDVHIQA